MIGKQKISLLKGKPMKVNFKKDIQYVNTDTLIIHPLALNNPKMTDEELDSIVADMKINGFAKDKPVVIWGKHTKKIIDGRNRLTAALMAGIEVIPTIEMSVTTKKADVVAWIEQQENRRHQTATQRAIMAFREKSGSGLLNAQLAQKHGIGSRILDDVIFVSKQAGGADMLDKLFNNIEFKMSNGRPVSSITALANSFRYKESVDDTIGMDAMQKSAHLLAVSKLQKDTKLLNPYELIYYKNMLESYIDDKHPDVVIKDKDPDYTHLKAIKRARKTFSGVSGDAINKSIDDIKMIAKDHGLDAVEIEADQTAVALSQNQVIVDTHTFTEDEREALKTNGMNIYENSVCLDLTGATDA